MHEVVLNNNNLIQQNKGNLFQTRNSVRNESNKKSFFERMEELKENNKVKRKKKDLSAETTNPVKKDAPLSEKEFLAKLKEILAKNKKEIPAELLTLLQGGSLTKQQEIMLGQMISNLQNQNLKVSDLKSLVGRNAEKFKKANLNSKEEAFFDSKNNFEELNSQKLRKIADYLKDQREFLKQKETTALEAELNQLAKSLLESDSLTEAENSRLKAFLKTENLNLKLNEFAVISDDSELITEKLNQLFSTDKKALPLLAELNHSLELDSNNTFLENSSLAVLRAQLEEIAAENKSQKSVIENLNLKSDNLESLNLNENFTVDSILDKNASENKDSFFNLNQNQDEGLMNFDFKSESKENDFNLNNLNSNSNNLNNLVKESDLKGQIVKQFKGEYSPETKEMQIQLKPESLGKIDLSLSYENEKLVGKMLVESEMVRAQLENSLKSLKTDLIKQGINIEQFKIETAKNSPQQVEKDNDFVFNDQNSAFSDSDTGHNQEYDQRQFFQGQYYISKNNSRTSLNPDNLIMKQQEIINRAGFSNDKLNLLA